MAGLKPSAREAAAAAGSRRGRSRSGPEGGGQHSACPQPGGVRAAAQDLTPGRTLSEHPGHTATRTGTLQTVPRLVPAALQGGWFSKFTDGTSAQRKNKLTKRNLSYLYKNGKEKVRCI